MKLSIPYFNNSSTVTWIVKSIACRVLLRCFIILSSFSSINTKYLSTVKFATKLKDNIQQQRKKIKCELKDKCDETITGPTLLVMSQPTEAIIIHSNYSQKAYPLNL